MAGRAKRAMLGFLTDTGGQAVIQVATLFATPIIMHLTSVTLYGFWLTALSVLAYLGLLDIGLGISTTRLLAGIHGKPDSEEEFNRILSTSFFSFCVVGVVFLCAGLVMAPYVPGWFKIPVSESGVVITAYKLAIIAGAIALPLSIFGATVVATQHMAVNNTIRNVVALLSLGLTIGLLYAGFGLSSLALANLFNFGTRGIVNYFFARRYCQSMKIRPFLVNRNDFVRIWKFGGYFQLTRFANIIAVSAGPIVIASYLGAVNVTSYKLTAKLATLFSIVLVSKLGIAVFPALSQMFANKEADNLRRVFIALIHISVRLAMIGGTYLAVANRHFITAWVGEDLYGGMFLNVIFVYWIFQDSILRSIGVVVQASGDLHNWAIASILEAAITVGLSVVLVRYLALPGVAIAVTAARTLTMLYIVCWISRKLKLPLLQLVCKGFLLPSLRGISGCIIVIALAITTSGNSHGWFWLVAVGLISFGLNIIAFEGIHFMRMSNLSWSERFQQMLRSPTKAFYE
jgi:O-antigen/teichoic acid export membrane protein